MASQEKNNQRIFYVSWYSIVGGVQFQGRGEVVGRWSLSRTEIELRLRTRFPYTQGDSAFPLTSREHEMNIHQRRFLVEL